MAISKTCWYDLLTRDHEVCKICFMTTSDHARRLADMPYPFMAPFYAPKGSYEKPEKPKTQFKGPWMAAAKATIRRHIRDEHPEWLDRVRWTLNAGGVR